MTAVVTVINRCWREQCESKAQGLRRRWSEVALQPGPGPSLLLGPSPALELGEASMQLSSNVNQMREVHTYSWGQIFLNIFY